MPDFTSISKFKLPRGITAFLHVRAGATRGAPPSDERSQLRQAQRQVKAQRRQIAQMDREISELRAEPQAAGGHRTSRSPNGAAPAFFVVGRGKSGTSWLMRTFNAHPEVLCRGEGRFFGRDWVREDLRGRDWKMEDLRK